MKNSKLPFALLLMAITVGGFYIHGWRIANLADTPSSKRPWGILVDGQYE